VGGGEYEVSCGADVVDGVAGGEDVGYVDEADDADVLVEFLDEIAFGNLLVEEVVEELDLGVVDVADDPYGFWARNLSASV